MPYENEIQNPAATVVAPLDSVPSERYSARSVQADALTTVQIENVDEIAQAIVAALDARDAPPLPPDLRNVTVGDFLDSWSGLYYGGAYNERDIPFSFQFRDYTLRNVSRFAKVSDLINSMYQVCSDLQYHLYWDDATGRYVLDEYAHSNYFYSQISYRTYYWYELFDAYYAAYEQEEEQDATQQALQQIGDNVTAISNQISNISLDVGNIYTRLGNPPLSSSFQSSIVSALNTWQPQQSGASTGQSSGQAGEIDLSEVTEVLDDISAGLDHPAMTTAFSDYTVAESLLLLLFLCVVIRCCIGMLKRGFSWLL